MPDPVLTNENPDRYAPPKTRVADTYASDGQTQPINLFSAKGRMGRLRYIFWVLVFTLVIVVISAIAMPMIFGTVFFAGASGDATANARGFGIASAIGALVFLAVMIAGSVFIIKLMIQRSHDMNWSGWSVLWMYGIIFVIGMATTIAMTIAKSAALFVICQIIMMLVSLIWMVKPGTPGANRFGPPPPPTPLAVKIGAWIFIVVMAGGFINNIIKSPKIIQTQQQMRQMQQMQPQEQEQTAQPEQTE